MIIERDLAPPGRAAVDAEVLEAPVRESTGAERPAADPMGRLKALLKEKRFETALAEAEAALVEQPRHVGILSAAASAAFSMGRNQEALTFIRRALYLQPDSSVLKESLGKIQRRIDEQKESGESE